MVAQAQVNSVQELQRLQAEALALINQSQEVRNRLAQNGRATFELLQSFGGNGDNVAVHHTQPTQSHPAAAAVAPKRAYTKRQGTQAKAPTAPKKNATASTESESGDNMGLKEVIWEILDRPENVDGLMLLDLASTIKAEGKYKTKSPDIKNMVYQTLYKMRSSKSVVRDPESKKFYIPEGGKLA